MMKFLSRSDEPARSKAPVEYDSTVTLSSRTIEGVEFTIIRLSFARRMELARRVLELSRQMEFQLAGGGIDETIEANILSCEIDRLYLRWGLVAIGGLTIDGMDATADLLAEQGPENLADEIVAAVKAQCGLTENERKN
jgi:hypothetical protein